MKKRVIQKEQSTVQTFSVTTTMKFQPKRLQKNQMLVLQGQKKPTKLQEQSSRNFSTGKRLKYVIELMPHHFLIGNENQLDFISVGGLVNQFVDVQYFWSLEIEGPIQQVQIDNKKSTILILSQKNIFVFSFNNKKKVQRPNLILTLKIQNEVKFMRFPKDMMLVIFYTKHFEVYNFNESNTNLTKTVSKNYGVRDDLILLDVPRSYDSFLNVFFQEPKKNQSFGLWCLNLTFDMIKVRIGTAYKIYDILKKLKKVLEIKNYTKEIIFINLGSQVIAAKKGFIIDSVNVNKKSQNSILRYMGHQKLLHITTKRVEVYTLKINTNLPNRMILKAIDSLELGQVSDRSLFMGVSMNKESNITVFFQNQGTNFSYGQIQYSFKTSYSIDRQSKIKKIFPYGKQISKIGNEILQSKYDIASKMGLSQKEIYLQIWNRSSKSTIQDYNFLLATKHYKTIRAQIQNKLRKQTMSFREILKIQNSCYEMLHKLVYDLKIKCTFQNLQDFLTSHYYLKKLNLFKEINFSRKSHELQKNSKLTKISKKQIKRVNSESNLNPESDQIMTIDIQQYSTFKQFDLKQLILDQISEFCFRDKFSMAQEIRLTFKQFKFNIRIFYKQLLKDIIQVSKSALLKLLSSIPQILPYKHILMNDQNPLLYEGVWQQIDQSQWQSNLYLDNIKTIQNKQIVEILIKDIWFKRNERIYHILVPKTKQQILKINQNLNSQCVFYFFLSQIFQEYKNFKLDFSLISEIVTYLENHFELFPEHLKSNVFLYFQLYQYYEAQKEWKFPKMNLQAFFNLKDYQLFRYFFDLEKIKKNCILKEIKPIFKKLHLKGKQIFNEGLLSYFDSQVSQLSDLKYLLNRINNEKAQFHQQNLSMYEILLKAMEMKIKIGTGEESQATISQVLVYIQNIPTTLLQNEENKKFNEDLKIIRSIQKHEKKFRKMNLNMTIQYMLKRCQDVTIKMVDFEIQDKKLLQTQKYQVFRDKSIKILQQIKVIKQNIYGDVYPNLALFAFSTSIMEKEEFIFFLSTLFQQQNIKKLFTFDINFVQNLVIYGYKCKFSKNSRFNENESYLRKLFQLLPAENYTRIFLESQVRLAIIFSQKDEKLEYPISVNYVVPKAFQIQQIIAFLSNEHLTSINLQQVCSLLNKMHMISKNKKEDQEEYISLHKVYEIFIQRLLQTPFSYNDCFKILRNYVKLKNTNQRNDIKNQLAAYLSILYSQIYTQLNEESRQIITQLLSLLYNEPQTLLNIFEHILTQKRTGLQMIQYLHQTLKNVHLQNRLCFNPHNPLIQQRLCQQVKSNNNQEFFSGLNKIIKNSLENVKIQRQFFRTNQIYSIIFYNLCHNPLNCLTILRFYKEKIKYKDLRSFISYLTQEIIISQNQLIQCFVITFDILLKNFKYNLDFQTIINKDYLQVKQGKQNTFSIFQQTHNIEIFQNPEEEYYKKLLKTLKRFLRKRNSLQSLHKSKRKQINKSFQIEILLGHESEIDTTKKSRLRRSRISYPFSDSDYANDDQANPTPPQVLRRRRKFLRIDFDCENQRLKMLKRNDQDLIEYLANTIQLTLGQVGPFGNEDAFSQKSSTGTNRGGMHKFKITQRKKSVQQQKLKQVHQEEKIKYKVNRFLGIQSIPLQYVASRNTSTIQKTLKQTKSLKNLGFFYKQLSQEDTESIKIDLSKSLKNLQLIKTNTKSNSSTQFKLETLPSTDQISLILLGSCSDSQISSIKIFDIKLLAKIKKDFFAEDQQNFKDYLKDLLKNIYESQGFIDIDKLNLINQIVKKYSTQTIFLNKKILESYLRFSSLKKNYDINIDTTKIFSFSGLLFEEPNGSSFYNFYHDKMLEVMDDNNAVKLSRLIALTFRKNTLEQQIIYAYFIKKLKQIGFTQKAQLDEKQESMLKKIIFSMTIKRFQDNFEHILSLMKQYSQKNESVKIIYRKIILMILQSIQKKGDYRTQVQLRNRASIPISRNQSFLGDLKLSTIDSFIDRGSLSKESVINKFK